MENQPANNGMQPTPSSAVFLTNLTGYPTS